MWVFNVHFGNYHIWNNDAAVGGENENKRLFCSSNNIQTNELELKPRLVLGLGPGLAIQQIFCCPCCCCRYRWTLFRSVWQAHSSQSISKIGRSVLNFKKPFNEAQLCWNTSVKIIIESLWAIRRWCSPISKVCARVFVWREIFATATAKTQFLTGL